MITKETLPSSIVKDITLLKFLVYAPNGLTLSNFIQDPDGKAYGACTYQLGDKTILKRFSKITPTKTGQFVTLWKRNPKGITIPFDVSDSFDYVVISARKGTDFGQFIFPKTILAEKGILTHNQKSGKRGFRIYPPWDKVTNKQAQQTQNWQVPYFYPITQTFEMDLTWIKKYFTEY